MGRKEKLIKRLKTVPTDFSYNELATLLSCLGYTTQQGSGSRVKFLRTNGTDMIHLHKPHPDGILKEYVLKQVIEKLEKEELI